MKLRLVNSIFNGVAALLNRLSPSTRSEALMLAIRPLVEHDTAQNALRFLFELDSRLYALQGKTSIRYDKGVHTKHRHINYHQFFIKNLKQGDRVLDIGSGNGFLAFDMANQVENSHVVGVELNEDNINFARQNYRLQNLTFIQGDVLKDLPDDKFDVLVLSNILEHIKDRVEFLIKMKQQFQPKQFIIRVPMFERDWRVPLKKELGMDYRLDQTHYTEYKQEAFFEEIKQSKLKPIYTEFRWGEIWSVVGPAQT